MPKSKTLNISELKRFDGNTDSSIYIAYEGDIYDVTECPKWLTGLHELTHFPAQDLTSELQNAPHGKEVFSFPCVKKIGRLVK